MASNVTSSSTPLLQHPDLLPSLAQSSLVASSPQQQKIDEIIERCLFRYREDLLKSLLKNNCYQKKFHAFEKQTRVLSKDHVYFPTVKFIQDSLPKYTEYFDKLNQLALTMAKEFENYVMPKVKHLIKYTEWKKRFDELNGQIEDFENALKELSALTLIQGTADRIETIKKNQLQVKKEQKQLNLLLSQVDKRIVDFVEVQQTFEASFKELEKTSGLISDSIDSLANIEQGVSKERKEVAPRSLRSKEDQYGITEMYQLKIHKDRQVLNKVLQEVEEFLTTLIGIKRKLPEYEKFIESLHFNKKISRGVVDRIQGIYETLLEKSRLLEELKAYHKKAKTHFDEYIFVFQKFVASELHVTDFKLDNPQDKKQLAEFSLRKELFSNLHGQLSAWQMNLAELTREFNELKHNAQAISQLLISFVGIVKEVNNEA